MCNREPKLANDFCFGGIVLCTLLYFYIGFSSGFGNWGDGASGSTRVSPWRVVIPVATYFFCGFLAAESTRLSVRKALAVLAHVLPLTAIPVLKDPKFEFLEAFYALVYLGCAAVWVRLLKTKKV